MQLQSLKISNFRVIKRAELEFHDTVLGIIGPNGAGKSSIIEAISWALYGNNAARTGRDEIKASFAHSSEDCEVSLAFRVGEERYRVVRRLAGRSERPEVQLYRGDLSESVGVNETKAYVGQLLGLDWKGFLSSFLARQQELNALSDLVPSKRRDHLVGMLGIERLDKALQRLKEDMKGQSQAIEVIDRRMVEAPRVETRVAELTSLINRLDETTQKLDQARATEERKSREAAETLKAAQDDKARYTQLTALAEAARRTLAELENQKRTLTEELSGLERAEGEIAGLDKELAGLEALRREADSLRQAEATLKVRKSIEADLKAVGRAIVDNSTRLQETEKAIEARVAELAALPEGLDDLAAGAEQGLEAAREKYTVSRSARESTAGDLKRLGEQLSEIGRLGPDSVCDRCLRPLGDDLPGIRSHLEGEMRTLEAKLQACDIELAELKDSGEKLRQETRKLAAQLQQRDLIRAGLDGLNREMSQCQKAVTEAESRQAELNRRLADVAAVSFDSDRLAAVAAELKRLEGVQSRRDQMRGRLARLPEVRSGLTSSAERISRARNEADRAESEARGLGFSPERFAAIEAEFKSAQAAFEKAREAQTLSSRELEIARRGAGDPPRAGGAVWAGPKGTGGPARAVDITARSWRGCSASFGSSSSAGSARPWPSSPAR